jgi:hypothetical protein
MAAPTGKVGSQILYKVKIGEAPPLSAAMNAVVTMVVIFFIVEVGKYVFTVMGEYERVKNAITGKKDDAPGNDNSVGGGTDEPITPKGKSGVKAQIEKRLKEIQGMINLASGVTAQIPMICILIVFARLRAKVDLEGTDPAKYAKNSFTATAVLVCVQAASLALSQCGETMNTVNIVLQGLCKFGIIVCVCVIVESIFTLKKSAPEF